MDERILFKLALITSVIGVIGLFFVMQNTEFKESIISDIELMTEGEGVRVIGTVENIKNINNITIISISQKQIIKAVVFDEVNVAAGDNVEVIGEIRDYKGEKEITVDSITKDMKN